LFLYLIELSKVEDVTGISSIDKGSFTLATFVGDNSRKITSDSDT